MFNFIIIFIGSIIIFQVKLEDIDVKIKDGVVFIDIVVIYGLLEIYIFFVNNNVMVILDMFIVCCFDGCYKNIKNWIERICVLYCCEKGFLELKMLIFVDL